MCLGWSSTSQVVRTGVFWVVIDKSGGEDRCLGLSLTRQVVRTGVFRVVIDNTGSEDRYEEDS